MNYVLLLPRLILLPLMMVVGAIHGMIQMLAWYFESIVNDLKEDKK